MKEILGKNATPSGKKLVRNIVSLASKDTGCSIQYGGCPCNSDFHVWAEDDLKLHPRLAHALWLITLSLRGDYEPQDLEEGILYL